MTESDRGAVAGRPHHLVAVACVVGLAFLAYWSALHGPFLFDDGSNIKDNPQVRDLARYLREELGAPRCVGYVSFALNYSLGGLDPFGYHVTNVAIHALNGLLVYALGVLTFRTPRLRTSALAPFSRWIALFAALLFVAHPIQTQAVTYIVQRLTSLATLFYLLTFVQFAAWRLRQEREAHPATVLVRFVPIVVTSALAMRTKEIAFTLPFVVLLYDVMFFPGGVLRRALPFIPLFATALRIPLTLVRLGGKSASALLGDVSQATRALTPMPRGDYATTELTVVAKYLRLLVLPVGQNVDHDHPIYRSLLEPRVLLSLALILGLAGLAVWLYRAASRTEGRLDPSARLIAFGIAWFFITLSVESSVIPIVDVIFEHRVYLPSVGAFTAVGTALGLASWRLGARLAARTQLAIGALVVVVLAGATYRRNEVWASELALWSDAVQKSPRKTRPHSNLALALIEAGRDQEALAHFEEVIRISPNHVDGHNNLAVLLERLGRPSEALDVLRRALAQKPDQAETYYNVGHVLLQSEGRYEDAVAMFRKAIELQPNYPQALANLAAALNRLGRHAETVQVLESASGFVEDSAEAHFNLAIAQVLGGNGAGAEREIRILEGLSPAMAVQAREYLARARDAR